MHSLEVGTLGCILQTAIFSRVFPTQSIAVLAGCSFIGSFALLVIWKLYLWPIWFSPLRNLPEPPVSTTIMCGACLMVKRKATDHSKPQNQEIPPSDALNRVASFSPVIQDLFPMNGRGCLCKNGSIKCPIQD